MEFGAKNSSKSSWISKMEDVPIFCEGFWLFFLNMVMTSDIDTGTDFPWLIFLGVDPRLESPHISGHLGAILSSKHRDLSVLMSSFPVHRWSQMLGCILTHCVGKGPWNHDFKGLKVFFPWKLLVLFEIHLCYGELRRIYLSWHLITWWKNWFFVEISESSLLIKERLGVVPSFCWHHNSYVAAVDLDMDGRLHEARWLA